MAPPALRPKAAAIDITVETLTGAGFRLRVSSHETVLSVKARIMRIEGVSISQQHLIYRSRELADSATLHDSGVRSGAKLQLVVAMRGGPVNTRRLPIYEDITHAEMQQLMEMQSDGALDDETEDARHGRHVTLLVFREGDQVSFYRVIENTDGSYSPLSDSWGSTLRSMFHEESTDDVKRRLDENTATMSKISELKRKMQVAQARKRDRLRRPSSRPLRTGSGAAGSSNTAGSSRRVRLPPVSTPTVRGSASFPPGNLPGTDLSESFSRLAAGHSSLGRHAAPSSSRGRGTNSPAVDAEAESRPMASRGNVTSGSHRRRKLSLSESTELYKHLQSQRALALNSTPVSSSALTAPRDYGAYRRTLARLTRYPSQPEVPSGGENSVELPVLFETDERKGSMVPRASALPGSSSQTDRPHSSKHARQQRPRTSPSQRHQSYSKDDLIRPGSATANLKPTDTKARQLCRILSANAVLTSAKRRTKTAASTPASRGVASTTSSAKLKTGASKSAKGGGDSADGKPTKPSAAPLAASRRTTASTKRPRCQLCRRRLGLAGVYRCYCAGVFCGQHRYPEMHHCGYDFKTEGRKLLERANPLVTAPKLPKI